MYSIKACNSTLRLTFQLNSLVRVSRRVEQLYLLLLLIFKYLISKLNKYEKNNN